MKTRTVFLMGILALLPTIASAVCTGGGNFQGSCTPADFSFVPPVPSDLHLTGHFWARCSATTPTRLDSRWNSRSGAGTDNGSAAAFGSWFDVAAIYQGSGNYRIQAGGWNYSTRIDGCPLTDNADCRASATATSETVFLVSNGAAPSSEPARFAIALVRYIGDGAYYDIDSVSGGDTSYAACRQTCQVTYNGGLSWLPCGGGQPSVAFSTQPTVSLTKGGVLLDWTLPAIRSNVAGAAYPISSWGIYRIDSETPPTSFDEAAWTEVRRVPGDVSTVRLAAAPAKAGWFFALKPRFDGNGGLSEKGRECTPGIDCAKISSNTFDPGNAPGVDRPKVGPASAAQVTSAGTLRLLGTPLETSQAEPPIGAWREVD